MALLIYYVSLFTNMAANTENKIEYTKRKSMPNKQRYHNRRLQIHISLKQSED